MDYRSFEKLCYGKKICIWGFGRIGKSFVYISLKCAGADITCFCDSKQKEKDSFDGIPLVSESELYEMEDVYTFIAVNSIEAQKKISLKLDEHGIKNTVFDNIFLTELCNSIEKESDEKLSYRYRNLMNDELYLKIIFKQRMGCDLNIDNPRTFNEKMQWLKIHDRKPLYASLVDKYEVKNYAAKKLGKDHVIPTLGIWDKFEDIDFNNLPNQFVLKCTHDSGSVVICTDKSAFDKDYARNKIQKALSTNYYWTKREWPYKNVKPRIIAEKYIKATKEEVLPVYKFFVFEGDPVLVQAIKNDKTDSETIDYFDSQWNLLDMKQNFQNSTVPLDKPKQFDEMLVMARKMSQGFRFIRIDFYSVDDIYIFSEITFFSDSGLSRFCPEEWDYKLGELIHLY